MIRQHVLAWVNKSRFSNQAEAIKAIKELPLDDQAIAFALFNTPIRSRVQSMVSMHFMDRWNQITTKASQEFEQREPNN